MDWPKGKRQRADKTSWTHSRSDQGTAQAEKEDMTVLDWGNQSNLQSK